MHFAVVFGFEFWFPKFHVFWLGLVCFPLCYSSLLGYMLGIWDYLEVYIPVANTEMKTESVLLKINEYFEKVTLTKKL